MSATAPDRNNNESFIKPAYIPKVKTCKRSSFKFNAVHFPIYYKLVENKRSMTITSCLNALKLQGIEITQPIFNLVHGVVSFFEKGLASGELAEIPGWKYAEGPDSHVDPEAYKHDFYIPDNDLGSSQLIWATMVSWWKTGDFTGSYGRYNIFHQGSKKVPGPPILSSYMKKHFICLFQEDKYFQSREVIYEYKFGQALWAISHWLSISKCVEMMLSTTRDINLRVRYNDLGPYVTQKSALVRLNGFPAGTTSYSIFKIALDEMCDSIVGHCVQCTSELSKILKTFVETYNLIHSDRKSYHRNADMLGVKNPLKVPPVPEELVRLLSSFLHVCKPESPLVRSKAVLSKSHLMQRNVEYFRVFREIDSIVSLLYARPSQNRHKAILRNLALADNPLPIIYQYMISGRKNKHPARMPAIVVQLKRSRSFQEMQKEIAELRKLKDDSAGPIDSGDDTGKDINFRFD